VHGRADERPVSGQLDMSKAAILFGPWPLNCSFVSTFPGKLAARRHFASPGAEARPSLIAALERIPVAGGFAEVSDRGLTVPPKVPADRAEQG
jgi:hypothetical protein